MRKKSGQNVIEYILLIMVVLGVFIIFLSKGGKYHQTVEHILFNGAVNQVRTLSTQIQLP